MLHFEDLWNSAEEIASKISSLDAQVAIENIKKQIDSVPLLKEFPAKQSELIGEIIFNICYLTYIYNINSADALHYVSGLKKATENILKG
jgi:hypothetical protein